MLNSLNSSGVEYLLVGGYAVIFHGYVRTTGDMDIWIAVNPDNAAKAEAAIRSLGFNLPWLKPELLLQRGSVLRIGQEPLRFDIINDIDGVTFAECFSRRVEAEIDGVKVNVISLSDLKANKKASGRHKDLADLDYLP
ncbi:MAG: nucleotidyltransferase [Verrucomicrobia bacterium]|nr:nucleotidyltransferase [Verrucomicrobiota bacterium]